MGLDTKTDRLTDLTDVRESRNDSTLAALSLAGKGRVVAKKRATRPIAKVPFPHCLNAV
jgi:hypothetical protein